MLQKLKRMVKKTVGQKIGLRYSAKFERKAPGWLSANLAQGLSTARQGDPLVERRAAETEARGQLPIWEEYANVEGYAASTTDGRSSDQVRTQPLTGAFFAWLAQARKPELIVEFGTAFGVSGMYWLTGLEGTGSGKLMTYEPNTAWGALAEKNLSSISDRFVLTRGTFEDNAAATLAPKSVDIAFIDAIHTSEFVLSQWEVLKPYMKPGAIVLFDDIGFSDDMARCWQTVAHMPEAHCSASLGRRLGIVELRS